MDTDNETLTKMIYETHTNVEWLKIKVSELCVTVKEQKNACEEKNESLEKGLCEKIDAQEERISALESFKNKVYGALGILSAAIGILIAKIDDLF